MHGDGNKHMNEDYNVYGRLVTKRKKGCSFFYSLLNAHAKADGWSKCCVKMEYKAESEGLSWDCDMFHIIEIVKQVNKTPYLNRLKQFFFRLLRIIYFLVNLNITLPPLVLFVVNMLKSVFLR